MRKASLRRLFLGYFLFTICSGFAHPFTPKFLQDLALPDYTYGVSYAFASLMGFLAGPLLGRISDCSSRRPLFIFGCFGYSAGQILYCVSRSVLTLSIARTISGLSYAGFFTCAMAYIVDASEEADRERYMLYFVVSTTVFQAVGYLIGGFVGDYSPRVGFLTQAALLALCGVYYWLALDDARPAPAEKPSARELIRQSNPVSCFVQARSLCSRTFLYYLGMVFLVNFGITGFENAFNYYLRAQLDFQPSYNGIIKATVGLTALLANFTISRYLARRTDLRKTVVAICGACAACITAALLALSVGGFLAASLCYYLFNSLYQPIQQELIVSNMEDDAHAGVLSGLFNSAKSIGNVMGSLSAGILYTAAAKLPFLCAAGLFLLGGGIAWINARRTAASAKACGKCCTPDPLSCDGRNF